MRSSVRLALGLPMAIVFGAVPAAAEVTWHGDFAGAGVPTGADQHPAAGRFQLGAAAAAGADGWQRMELRRELPGKSIAEGGERFYAFSVFVPKGLPPVVHQIARFADPSGEVLFAFVSKGEVVDIVTYDPAPHGHYGGETSRLRPGVWHRVIVRVLWSRDEKRGLIDCWYDGDKMVADVPLRTKPAGGVTFGLGLSRQPLATGDASPTWPSLAFIDEAVESTALADLRQAEIPKAPGDFYPDVEYARPKKLSLKLDAWVPRGPGPHPAVILVHGGGFIRGDKQSYVRPLFHVLADAGFAWFTIDHRLAPRYKWPAALDDVEAAVKWVHKHAAKYRIDTTRVALLGESAGGFLVSAVGVRHHKGGPLAAVLPFYTFHAFDLPKGEGGNPPPVPTKGVFADLFGIKDTGARTQAVLRAAMPLYNLHPDMPPYGLYHAKDDGSVPFAQSPRMCDAMRAVGARCDVLASEGLGHGLRKWADVPAEHARLIAWLRDVMKMPAP